MIMTCLNLSLAPMPTRLCKLSYYVHTTIIWIYILILILAPRCQRHFCHPIKLSCTCQYLLVHGISQQSVKLTLRYNTVHNWNIFQFPIVLKLRTTRFSCLLTSKIAVSSPRFFAHLWVIYIYMKFFDKWAKLRSCTAPLQYCI